MKKLILFVFLLPLLFSCEQEKPQPPNIVFIMSDDHAFQAVSAYGHDLNNTPNIDRIAQEGALFNKGFVTNSICAPSRAVMLTGKHSFVNGKVDNIQDFNWEQPNFAKTCKLPATKPLWWVKSTSGDCHKVLTILPYYPDKDITTIPILSSMASKNAYRAM